VKDVFIAELFLLSTCKMNDLCLHLSNLELSSCQHNLSASVPLTAIAEAIQEIEVHVSTDPQTRQEAIVSTNVQGTRLYFPCHTGIKSWDCHLSLKQFQHSLF